MTIDYDSVVAEAMAAIANEQGSMLERVKRWANMNSGSRNLEGLTVMWEALADNFGQLPGRIERITLDPVSEMDSRGQETFYGVGDALRIQRKGSGPYSVLFSGHMDTVFGVDSPFQHCQQTEGNRLIGPGVADMKGGLVIMLNTLQQLENSPLAGLLSWEILITADEEIGSLGSSALLQETAQRHDFAFAYESTPNGHLARQRMGGGAFTLIVEGRAAHVGRAFAHGRNAILHLGTILQALHDLNGPGVIINPANIHAPGPVNVVPNRAVAQVNIRVESQARWDGLKEDICELIAEANAAEGYTVQWHGQLNRMPKEVNAETEMLFQGVQQIAAEMGMDLDWQDTGGGSDGNILATAGLPNLDNMGAQGANLHQEDEYLEVDSLVTRTQLGFRYLAALTTGRLTAPKRSTLPS